MHHSEGTKQAAVTSMPSKSVHCKKRGSLWYITTANSRTKYCRLFGNFLLTNEEDDIKYTNWADDWDPLTGDCVSINASNGKWEASGCLEKLNVVCQRGQQRQFSLLQLIKFRSATTTMTLVNLK